MSFGKGEKGIREVITNISDKQPGRGVEEAIAVHSTKCFPGVANTSQAVPGLTNLRLLAFGQLQLQTKHDLSLENKVQFSNVSLVQNTTVNP